MPGRSWTKMLAQAVLLGAFAAAGAVSAQTPDGSISIRLTDLYSKPLEGVAVTLRNQATGRVEHAVAAKGAVYRFVALEPGDYALEVLSPRRGEGKLDGIAVSAGHESHIQAAVELRPIRSGEIAATAVQSPTRVVREGQARLPMQAAPRTEERSGALPESGSLVNELSSEQQHAESPAIGSLSIPAPRQGAPLRHATFGSALGGACVAKVGVRIGTATLQSVLHAAGPALNPNGFDAAVAVALPAAQLQALPLAGRDWRSLDAELPMEEVSGEDGPSTRTRDASIRVDGADTRLAFGNAYAGRSRGPGTSLMGVASNEGALRQLETGFVQGSFRSITTERGTSRLRGQAAIFDRQNVLDARNPFTQWVQQTAPATATTIPTFSSTPYSPGDREMSWSASLGGPLLRHRLAWFASVNNAERGAPAVSTVKHPDNFFAQPSNDQMQVLSARLGLNGTNPVVAGLAAYSGMLQTLDGLLGPASRAANQWSGFGRLDWAASRHRRFVLEGSTALWDSPGGGLARASEAYGTHSYGSSRVDDQWVLSRWEETLGSRWIATSQVSLGRRFVAMPPQEPSAFEKSLDVRGLGRLPQITVDSRYGFTIGTPSRFGPGGYPDEHLYEVQETLHWAHANGFAVSTGLDVRHNDDATGLLRNSAGAYHYASLANFASDALAFAAFGLSGQLNPLDQHNCDQTGKVWRDSSGTLHGLGYLPCYSWYSQTIGPSNWWLTTNDWAAYLASQWHPAKTILASLSMRWSVEQGPPPMALLDNPDLPLTQKMPSLGSQWGPSASLAWGTHESRWPVLHIGYGMHFGRTMNRTFENALTETGSPKGDLTFFVRPTDNLNAGGAPPFPYVLAGEPSQLVKPEAVEFAPAFRNGEVHQAIVSAEETLPAQVRIEAGALASLGRRLPRTEDANIDPASNPPTITYAVVDGNGSGPIKASQITVPFFASWPSSASSTGVSGRLDSNYQRVTEIFSSANSTYEAALLRITRTSRDGFTVHARYAYAHAMDWNPNESVTITRPSVFDPTHLRDEYGTSDLDIRHSLSIASIWEPRWKVQGDAGRFANGWMLSTIGAFHSGSPYTMRTAGALAKEFDSTGAAIVALEPGMNGYGGENRVYGVGRNTFRYPATWKADVRLGKRFDLGSMRQIELLVESFNLFNHQNTTELETVGYSIESGSISGGLPTLNFLTGLKSGQTEFGKPLNINATDFYRPRQFQFGMRARF